jgi:hypothetical protein
MGVRDSLASIPSFRGKFLEPEGSLQGSNSARAFPTRSIPGGGFQTSAGCGGHVTESHLHDAPVGPGDNDNIVAGNVGSVFPDGDQTNPDNWLCSAVQSWPVTNRHQADFYCRVRDVIQGLCRGMADIQRQV